MTTSREFLWSLLILWSIVVRNKGNVITEKLKVVCPAKRLTMKILLGNFEKLTIKRDNLRIVVAI